jgi:hypothetical protein
MRKSIGYLCLIVVAIILKADRSLFGRIIVMAENRNLQMSQILAHPLGPLPWSLATPDGQLRKTNKAALAAHFKKMSSPVEHPPNHGRMASVIDLALFRAEHVVSQVIDAACICSGGIPLAYKRLQFPDQSGLDIPVITKLGENFLQSWVTCYQFESTQLSFTGECTNRVASRHSM